MFPDSLNLFPVNNHRSPHNEASPNFARAFTQKTGGNFQAFFLIEFRPLFWRHKDGFIIFLQFQVHHVFLRSVGCWFRRKCSANSLGVRRAARVVMGWAFFQRNSASCNRLRIGKCVHILSIPPDLRLVALPNNLGQLSCFQFGNKGRLDPSLCCMYRNPPSHVTRFWLTCGGVSRF